MVSEVNLSAATANNLLALQRTTSAIVETPERLSTGLKVRTTDDEVVAIFDAQTLSSRAADLLALKSDIEEAVSATDTAIQGISSIKEIVEQMKGLALSAQSDASTENRSKSAVQFNDLRSQLNNVANDATFIATNLIKGSPGNLKVTFSEDGSSTLTISGIASDSSGLSIVAAASNWGGDTNTDAAINDLDSALTTLRSSATIFGSNLEFISLRLDFNTNLINSLEEGAGKFVNADLDEEAAKLLTLQTRQQLGIIGLSIAQQSEQAVFRLF